MDQLGGDQSMLSGSPDSGKSKQDDIVIHTMQDDLALVKSVRESRETSSQKKSAKAEAPVVDQVTNRKSDQKVSLPQENTEDQKNMPAPMPVASTNASIPKSQKVVMEPPKKTKGRSNFILKALVVLLVLVIIGGSGVVAWKFILFDYFTNEEDTGGPVEVAVLEEMIPQDVYAMINYKMDSDQDVNEIVSAWQNTSGSNASLSGLLDGDPRYLIENYSVDQMHYLLLEGDSKPYILIPVTEQTTRFVDSAGTGEILSKNGWYILHSFDTDPYEQKLSEGVWSARGNTNSELSLLDNKIGVILGEDFLKNARASWNGNSFTSGLLKELLMGGSLTNQGSVLALEGVAEYTGSTGNSASTTDQRLMEVVPSDTDIVRIGANFVDDLYAWDNEAQLLDRSTLEKPTVQALLSDLTTPYAYYLRERQDGMNDIGIVIKIPASLSGQLAVGDESLEEALPAIIPLIAQRTANVSFAFADNTHSELPLRYVNINGPNQALDYAIVDDYILIATSKEGMFTLIDTYNGNSRSLNTGDYWQALLSSWGTIPQASDIVIGRINSPILKSLLPIASDNQELLFGFSAGVSSNSSATVSGIFVLNSQTQTSIRENDFLTDVDSGTVVDLDPVE